MSTKQALKRYKNSIFLSKKLNFQPASLLALLGYCMTCAHIIIFFSDPKFLVLNHYPNGKI